MARPCFEPLEDLTLLSASILGTVWADPNGSGVRPTGAAGVADQTVYLDLNHDGKDDDTVSTVAATSTTIGPASGQLGGIGGFSMASLPVQGLPATISDLRVNLDLTNNGASAVQVGVISPTGLTVPDFPILFSIQPGEHFDGSFDQNASAQITLATSPPTSGTYVPQQLFTLASAHIYDGSPDGTWGLVFAGDTSGLVLSGWSLSFTTPDPSTETDAGGNYSFTGLAPGTYQVETLAPPGGDQTSPAGGAAQTVTVADGQTVSGIDFGVQTASDLTAQSFTLAAPATAWGQDVTINYTLTNQGQGDAPAFDVGFYLSADGVIRTTGPLLGTARIDGLASQATTRGSVTFQLPAAPPSGFGAVTDTYVGLYVDPAGALAHNDAADGNNQGFGVDTAPLAVTPNTAVAAGPGVQQMPNIAVDPNNPNHLVVAYMDSTLVTTGYEGIGVSVSYDDGTTWTRTSIPLPAGFSQGAATPTAQFNGQGDVFVSFMAATFLGVNRPALTNPASTQRLDGFTSNNGIFVAESQDGGLSWGTPVAVESFVEESPGETQVPFDFSPAFAVDTYKTLPGGQPNPDYDDLYVAWVRAYPAGQFPGQPTATAGTDIMFSVSSNGGASWTTQLQTDPTTGATVSAIRDPEWAENGDLDAGRGYMNDPQVSVGPAGDIYVSAYAGNNFDVFHSFDGGAGFTPPNLDEQLGLPFYGLLNLPYGTLANDTFRTNPVRDIVADPAQPGRVYVVEANPVDDSVVGGIVDAGEILFAYSNDYGQTWQDIFQVGHETTNFSELTPAENDTYVSVLNDDDNGDDIAYDTASQLNTEVIDGQALPSLSVDAQGDIAVIWYDTRRDPLGQNLDVFGTVSTDGGRIFSPNFRITDTSFNPTAGAFVDAQGNSDDYLGDRISVVADDGVADAVWTDTRNGTQDIYFQSFPITPAPAPSLDRLAPNGTPASATNLGQVTAPLIVPAPLIVEPGADSWFRLQAGATGALDVTVTSATGGGAALSLQLTAADGNPLPADVTPVLNSSGVVVGEQAVYASSAGQTYLVHVSGGSRIDFSLTVAALTADLGTGVQGGAAGSIAAGGTSVYRLTAGVAGSLDLTLTPAGNVDGGLVLQILSADGQTVLASSPASGGAAEAAQSLALAVAQGQTVLIEVSGSGPNAQGGYTLGYTNLDQYEAAGVRSTFLPTTGSPASVAVADLTGQSTPDIIVSSTNVSDPVDVLLGNSDGTFQAPHEYDVGPGLNGALNAGNRQIGVADFNNDGTPDVVVPNFRAADVSVLLGDGDGTFEPQRRFDAVPSPSSLVTGDFANNGDVDIAVLENYPQSGGVSELAILMGRGDGTFKPAVVYPTMFSNGAGPMVVGDFTGNGIDDIIVFSNDDSTAQVFLGNGDGTFRDGPVISTGEDTLAAEAVDLDGDGTLSLITTGINSGNVYVIRGNGDGTFQTPQPYNAMPVRPGDNVSVSGLAVVGLPSTVSGSPGPSGLVVVNGTPGIYVTAASRSGAGPAEVIFLPAEFDDQGRFTGLGAAEVQAQVGVAGQVAAFDENGQTDLVAADSGGVRVLYGLPASATSATGLSVAPNTTPATAQNLGSVDHLVTLPRAIVAGFEDAYDTFLVPTEDDGQGGAQVVDFSALFQDVVGAGLEMVVTDASGAVVGSGDRFRVIAPQGSVLTIHVFGVAGTDGGAAGAGVYTLDIDVLPQVASVQPQSALPGGPIDSLVLTLQGDQLDPTLAENPANYTVSWLGPNGPQVIPIAADDDGQAVVYDPNTDADVTSGLAYATGVRQKITLLFANPLPAGSYQITLSPSLQTAPFNGAEAGDLSGAGAFGGHPLVSVDDGGVLNGASLVVDGLVAAPVAAVEKTDSIVKGTPFLTQLQSDLITMLDDQLEQEGDSPSIPPALNDEILSRYAPLFEKTGSKTAGAFSPSFTIIWLDPVSLDLQSPQGLNLSYNLSTNTVSNGLGSTYVSVGGNVELIVMENAAGTFNLDMANVPASARGGEVQVSANGFQSEDLTGAMRDGATSFALNLGGSSGGGTSGPSEDASGVAQAGTTQTAGLSSQGAATFAATFLTGTLIIPGTESTANGETANAETEAAGAQATTTASQATTTTAVAQSLLAMTSRGSSGQSDEIGVTIWTPAVQALVEVMKGMLSNVDKVVGVWSGKPASTLIRYWQNLLDVLIRPIGPASSAKAGAGNGAAKILAHPTTPAAPAADPLDSGRLDGNDGTQGLDGLIPGPDRPGAVGRLDPTPGTATFWGWGTVFLASGLARSGVRDLPRSRPGSSPSEKSRSAPKGPEPVRRKAGGPRPTAEGGDRSSLASP